MEAIKIFDEEKKSILISKRRLKIIELLDLIRKGLKIGLEGGEK